ncbi:trace amine-associated receptor 13c-like [Anguilla anguilla]|uniref:trace amine-associated receptor 13c-like n=1 Tax=Anguilla anguilla TaxID=7936 RepID=UPI0015A9C761|nr:trace amine-associated receptor 13c-like [Anguilla anguilla]
MLHLKSFPLKIILICTLNITAGNLIDDTSIFKNLTKVHKGESCGNSSTLSCSGAPPTPADVLLYMTVAAVIFVTVCGNLLVIVSICHFKQLHTPTNILLLSLAVADFLVGVTGMPFHFISWLDPHWCLETIYCTLFNIASFYMTCVSIYNVALIAVDRYFALSNPFLYCTKMTVNLTLRMLYILWLSSLIYNVLFIYINGNISEITGNVTCTECIVTANEFWTIFDFVIVFIVPCVTIIIMYLNVFAIARKHAHEINCVRKQNSSGTKMNNFSTGSERKAAKKLGILVAVFLLCLLPYYINAFLSVYITTPSEYLTYMSTVTLLYLNSSINPIIYALFYPWFQKSVKLILTFRICGSESSLLNVLLEEN